MFSKIAEKLTTLLLATYTVAQIIGLLVVALAILAYIWYRFTS